MTVWCRTILLSLLTLLLCFGTGYALDVPPLQAHVNDYASMLSQPVRQELEQRLTELEQSDSTQVVVLTVTSLDGEPIESFSIRVAEAWKIGREGKDNGAILLLAKAERKIRIEVGRGLEGKVTDLVAGRIIRGVMSPRMKSGDVEGGIVAGTMALVAASKGEFTATPRDIRHGKKGASPVFTLLIFTAVAAVFLGSLSRPLGGVAGAAGVPLAAFLSGLVSSMAVLAVLAAVGFAAGLLLAFLFGSSGRGGGGFSGPFIGGFGGGGFSGGGGFGGFAGGGGSFGGGGASGDW